MAKKKPETLLEKVSEGVDKILHPENHGQDQDADPKGTELVQTSDGGSEGLVQNETEPVDTDSISQHKKFDKFKTQGEHLDDK